MCWGDAYHGREDRSMPRNRRGEHEREERIGRREKAVHATKSEEAKEGCSRDTRTAGPPRHGGNDGRFFRRRKGRRRRTGGGPDVRCLGSVEPRAAGGGCPHSAGNLPRLRRRP